MFANRDRLAAHRQEQAQQEMVGQQHQRHQQGGHRHIGHDAGAGDLADPVPALGADVLRRHRADRAGDGEGGHLDIAPQLVRRIIGRDSIDALAIDQPGHHQS